MRTLLATAIGCSLLVGNSGCMGMAAKRAASEFLGASSKATPVPGTTAAKLAPYQSVTVNNPQTNLGGLVSHRFTSALGTAVRDALAKGEKDKPALFPGGSPALEVDPEIMWYQEAGGLGEILGSESFAVVLFYLKADGAEVGRVQVATKSAATTVDAEDMAKSMAKELAKFLEKGRAKSGDKRKRAD